ncbi:MAG TPA: hypothetical protein VFC19_00595 [Candidatus Limnocylindrales bacterium]|nr:hypothetical protein [Candidatus Limnocylindrales bacterium]
MRPLLVVLLAAASVLLPTPAGAAPVTKRLAVVTIQNGDTDNERTQLADTTYLRNMFFGGSGSLATWMPAVTHGQLSYVPAGDGVFVAEPNAALRDGDRGRCLTDAARSTAEGFLSARGIAWDAVAIVFDIGGCGWGGLGQMPGKISWYPPKPSLSAIVHEIGHNLGYPHENKRDCAGGSIAACRSNGYSGNSPMGGGGSGRGYSSVELMHSGWVESSWLVRTGKPGTFTLKPLHSPVSTTGTRVVEYQASANTSYVIEARAASSSGVDSAFTNPVLRVYSVSNRDYRNAWMVNPGGTVILDATHKITINLRSPATVEIAAIGTVSAKPSPSRPAVVALPSASGPASPAAASATPAPDPEDFDDPNSLADSIIAPTSPPARTSSSLPLLAAGIVLTAAAVLGALFFALPGRRGRGRHAA